MIGIEGQDARTGIEDEIGAHDAGDGTAGADKVGMLEWALKISWVMPDARPHNR